MMDWSYEGWPAGMFWLWVLLGALLIGGAAWLTARRFGRRTVAGSPDGTLDRRNASGESGDKEFEEFEEFEHQSAGRVETP